jgi:pectin methylesterase-like acyl-CoA thioesterase
VTAMASNALGSALSALPNQIAVDPTGNVYAATAGSASITKLSFTAPSTYTATTISNAAIVSAAAIAVDANGNVYVADNTTGAVVKFSQTTGLATTLTATAFTNPVALALDNVGNVLVADKGAGKVYRLPTGGVRTGLPPVVAVTGTIVPVGVAADAAGDVFIADSQNENVVMVPASGVVATVATGFTTLNGIAVDGAGNLYATDAATPGILKVLRNQYSFPFGSSLTTTLAGTVTNAGDAAATGFVQTDAADFQLTGTGSTCNTGATSVQPGAACTVLATFAPAAAGSGTISDVLSFLPPTSFGALSLTAVKTGNTTTTTTTIGGETPTAPVYVAGGASVTFAVTVAASTGTAIGNVTVSLDGGTGAVYPLNANGVAMVALTGLTAGTHTLAASYPTQGGVSGSNSTPFSFSVARATTTVTWTPTTLTEQYSQAIGVGVFNATSGGVAGAFVYSATPSGGTTIAVDSSSYLAIGSYSLGVVFTPTDQVDYAPSSGSIPNFTVTKANTSAPVGASTNVVAADGSGNFTNVASAVAALPATGGNIYIKPGTYTGQFTVSYPNVSLRGLGGVAQNVILTAEAGAFSTPLPTGVLPGNNGAQGDQGSATVVVDKSTINGTSYTPLNFYAENLSIQNTYDSDATNSNTLATVNGNCTAGQPATNNFALYNAGTLCAPQALAVWTRGDKSVFNNVRLISLQDTLFAGSVGCGTACTAARQYFYNGYITGDVDYIFGDAAMVFDHTTFFTTFHGLTATGTETIEAQNKARQTGSAGDYLSAYILNSANLTSQAPGMTQLYFGRPYGQYSTFIMLNTTVDQVNPLGWFEFSSQPPTPTNNLPTSTYAEFNTQGPGGTAASIAGRETISLRPEQLTAAQAAQYAPVTFLSTLTSDVWNPADALTAGVNGFVPSGTALATTFGKSITILARPQTPGGGAIPTGNYTLMDGSTVLSSGTLDPSGSAYLTTSALTAGVHNITLSYAGDANFNASTTSTPLVITVGGTHTAVAVTTTNPVYGTSINVTVTVTQNAPTTAITGTALLSVDGGTPISAGLTGGVATFTLNGVGAGAHTITAAYSGDTNNGTSTGTASVTVAKAGLTITGPTVSVVFGSAIPTYTPTYTGFVGTDTAATALTGALSLTTTPATPTAVGSYPIVAAVGTAVAPNYSLTFVNGLLTIGKAPTTTTLASSNASPGQNVSVTFTATVVSTSKAATPTGFVGFYSGTTLLSNITLPANGVATYTAGFSTLGAASITAVYSGDSSFSGSTSSAATETTVISGFGVSASPSSLTIQRGSTGTTTITLTPTGNYVGTASLACSGLPTYATCAFSNPNVTFTGNNAAMTSTLTIGTGSAHSSLTAPTLHRTGRTSLAGFFLLPGTLLAGLICIRRRRLQRSSWSLFTVLLLSAAMLAAAGCGSSPQETLAGTDTITITANSINATGTATQQLTLNVIVTQ